jgi:hypothetical protein
MTMIPPPDPSTAMSTVVEASKWILPATQELYKHRKDLQPVFKKVLEMFGKKKIVFMGDKGVGKTVLLDYITGKVDLKYKPPTQSESVETGGAGKLLIKVVPGYNSPVREKAEIGFFLQDKSVDGVVYVVANGFASTRNELSKEFLIRDSQITTLEKYRELQLQSEIRDLQEVCKLLRRSIRTHRKPTWMIVAVAKMDLYYNFVQDVARYYSPYGNSPFSNTIRELQFQVGSDNFSWDAVPVSTWLEDFSWNGQIQSSTLRESQRNHFLIGFIEQLEDYAFRNLRHE